MLRVALGLLLLLGMPTLSAAEPLTPTQYLELHQRADQRYTAGQMDEALPLYERLSAANPDDGELRLRLAHSLLATGDPAGLELAEAALAQGFGNEPEVAYAIARNLATAGLTEVALGWLEHALGAGFEDQATIKGDPAFSALVVEPRFRALAGMLPSNIRTREQGWTYDLDLFLAETRRLHAAPDGIAHSTAIEQAIEMLKSKIGTLSDEQIAVELQAIIVRLGDGHSSLLPIPTDKISFETLPVAFYWFEDGVFVTAATESDLIGKQVIAIGGRSIESLREDLRLYVSRDNDHGLPAVGVILIRYPSLLRAMGYANAADSVRLTLADATGSEAVELVPASFDLPAKLTAPPRVEIVPLWLRRPGNNFWHEPLPELDALYVQFNRVRDKPDQTIADYADLLKAELQDRGYRNLILDLRHNGGGNNSLVRPLVRLAVWHEEEAPDHRLFVITGQRTFSAAQNFVNRLEQMTDAVFVGEPSSSRPNFTGETTTIELPYSGIRLSISSRYWQDSQPGDRRPFIPVAMPVTLSSHAYFAGRDPVMEALRELLAD